jgi:hypothetical protein
MLERLGRKNFVKLKSQSVQRAIKQEFLVQIAKILQLHNILNVGVGRLGRKNFVKDIGLFGIRSYGRFGKREMIRYSIIYLIELNQYVSVMLLSV